MPWDAKVGMGLFDANGNPKKAWELGGCMQNEKSSFLEYCGSTAISTSQLAMIQ